MVFDAHSNSTLAANRSRAGALLLDHFEAFAMATPAATALSFEGCELTYAELNARANQLAHALIGQGIGRGDCVMLALPASADCIAAMLAVMKAGAAYAPVGHSWPPARIAAIHERLNAALMIGTAELDSGVAPAARRCTVAELLATNSVSEAAARNPAVAIEAQDLCYVMHTSGSSGQPKGVLVTHRNLQGMFADAGIDRAPNANDKWSWLHAFTFGYSAWEIWGALAHGGCLVIVPEAMRRDPAAWVPLLNAAGVTMLSLTPSGLRQLAATRAAQELAGRFAPAIVFSSGEALRHDDLVHWRDLFGQTNARLINIFALTETAGRVATKMLSGEESADESLIGGPADDVEIFIVAEPDNDVAAGAGGSASGQARLLPAIEGELLVAGPMLSPGYLADVELSADRFIDYDPGDGIARRCYRTGDRVRLNRAGELEFLGRIDAQIKLRGYRIEPADIEHVLRRHPDIADAAVTLHTQAAGAPQLAALVVRSATANAPLEFWPSLGEHLLYDELLYDFMAADQVRIESYRQAFAATVRDKVVLDIGTGRHAVLARLCAAAGARKVYAVELLEAAASSARQLIDELGLNAQVEVICGDIQQIEFPEKIDVCTQGVVGNIGSSDGIVPLWNAARRWFAEDFRAVPEQCLTLFAPGELPAHVREHPVYPALARQYLDALYADKGQRFDPRLCVRNFPPEQLLAAADIFETLDFNEILHPSYSGQCEFVAQRAGYLDGFLLWTRLSNRDADAVDFLAHQQAWLPVWLPVTEQACSLRPGDRLRTQWSCATPVDSVFPDYEIRANVYRDDLLIAELTFASPHQSQAFGQTPLHRALANNAPAADADFAGDLAAFVGSQLPPHMVPARWEVVANLPVNANGKLARGKLARLLELGPADVSAQPPSDDWLMADMLDLWSTIVGRTVGPEQDFFAAGGDSILAVRLTTEVQNYLDDTVFLAALFDAPTVAEYCEWLRTHHADAVAQRLQLATQTAMPASATTPSTALSHAQQSLWFLQQLYPASTAANEQFLIRIDRDIDADRLCSAWNALMRRHQVFQIVFAERDGQPEQLPTTRRPAIDEVFDWRALEPGVADAKLHDLAQLEMRTGFDLANGPLLRPKLVMLPKQRALVLATAHHIIADGLTVPILARELAAIYAQGPEALPEPALQFSEYVQREREQLTPEFVARESHWWRAHLEGQVEAPLLPAVAATPARPRASRHVCSIAPATAERLRALGRAEKASAFMVLLAAWRVWLSRCLGADDLLIGTPMTLRKDQATAELPGCMVNNIALRNPVPGDRAFRDVLIAERAQVLAEWEHSLLPFDKVVEAVRPERVMGRHPLFQSMYFYSEQPASSDGFTMDVLPVARDSFWDLDLTVTDFGTDAAFELVISTRDDLVRSDSGARWPAGFAALLETIATQPDCRVQDLPLTVQPTPMPASDPQRCDDVDVSLFAQFEQVAAATPHASAVSDTNETLTYQALLANATRYCAGLQAAAVKPGDVVGVATPRSAQTIALLLGINRAGASWLALDPTWPEERIAAMLADARPVLIVTDTELGPSTGAVGPVYRSLVDLHGDAASARTAPPAANAFILFTSGSTGRPKGAALPAAGVLNRCRWMWRAYGFSHSDRFAQRSSLNFVDSAWEIFGPLLHGAELVVMPQPLAADPAGLVSWLDAERISHLVTVPALLDALLREDLSHVASLRSVITSGEALLPDLLLRFQQALPDCVLLNTYGATEFWDASCARVDQLDVTDLLRVPIGKPIPNMRGDIVNRDGQLLPPGMPGELCVSGINVARGYLANAELSAEKFSTSSDGEPQYRTGDLAISAADGAIELLGRADRQFKLNGIRVEPTDIEANALACDGVVSAAVVLAEHETATRPVLFVLAGPGKPLDANRVRRFMEQRLPLAIVPADVRVLEDWPFTPSGKTDLRKLTERIQASLEPTRFVPARNDTERMIADVWQDVLNVDKVGAQADFFALGGHSLLATRVIARLTEAAGVELPLTSLFEQRTVERLAESIDALRSLSAQAALPDAGDESREVFRL